MAADIKQNRAARAISLIEEAFFVAREMPAASFIPYCLGTMPFLLGLLYFWNDMSQNAYAKDHCITASLGLALLFVWMKAWQAVFALKTYAFVSRVVMPPWSIGSVFRLVTAQTIVQTTGIVILPVALVVTIPFVFTYTLYQFVLVQPVRERVPLNEMIKENVKTAQAYGVINHLVLLIFWVFGFFVAVNVAVTLYSLPFLAKMLFGLDSVFTMGGFNPMNTTYLFSVVVITHLCVDPIIKIICILETAEYRSRETGQDLIARFNLIKSASRILAVFICILPFLVGPDARAQDGIPHEKQAPVTLSVDAQKLGTAIEQTMAQREYAWRLPMEKKETLDDPPGFFYKSMEWIFSQISGACRMVASWVEAFWQWLEKLMPKPPGTPQAPEPRSLVNPKLLAAGLLGLALVLLLIFLRSLFKRDPLAKPSQQMDAAPDISDDGVLADQLPADQWVDLGRELMEKGDLRLALRAVYLGTLARLARKNFIRIAGHKSNREYTREVGRKAHENEQLVRDFGYMVNTVDQVWYGMRKVNQAIFEDFFAAHQRIANVAG